MLMIGSHSYRIVPNDTFLASTKLCTKFKLTQFSNEVLHKINPLGNYDIIPEGFLVSEVPHASVLDMASSDCCIVLTRVAWCMKTALQARGSKSAVSLAKYNKPAS